MPQQQPSVFVASSIDRPRSSVLAAPLLISRDSPCRAARGSAGDYATGVSATELELKFHIAPERLAGVRAAMTRQATATVAAPQRMRLQACYFDTPDGALAAAHLSLRLRKEGRRWVQTLKAPGDSAVRRLEHEVEVRAPDARGVPAIDVARHLGTDAGRALDRVLKHGDRRTALVVHYLTDVWRRRLPAAAAGGQLEIAFDEGRIVAGERSLPVCEIEFELKSGPSAALFEVARAWRAAHGLCLATVSKAERGERLVQGSLEIAPVKAGTPRVDAGMDGETLLRAVVADCLDQILGNAGEIAAGRFGPDHVHQLRIGIRRLRTVLRELGACATAVDPGWEAPLVQAFRALGEYRDRDTAAAAVQPWLRTAGAPCVDLPAPMANEVADPVQTVRADNFQATLLALLDFALTEKPAEAGAGAADVRDVVARRLRKLHRQVVDDGKRFERLDETSQHRVRKRLKRLRYLTECVAPLFGARAVERYLKRLRPAQEALGAHNDAHVALGLYRQAAESDPKAWFAVGWLQARQGESAVVCQRTLEQVAVARRFWKA